MKFDISIRIAGEAGQGIQTIGSLLCHAVRECGWELFAHQDYMSRVRGGNNFFQVRIGSEKISACRETFDVLAALNAESVTLHRANLAENGKMILDTASFGFSGLDPAFINVPFVDIATRMGESKRNIGSVVFGFVAGMLAIEWNIIEIVVKKEFDSKGKEIVDKNIACVRDGYELGLLNTLKPLTKTDRGGPRYMLDGNKAIALGAAYAGCRFYSGYPMTPSTTIMETMAEFSSEAPIVVEQAEDEIAAINMVIGASYAGVRAMTATSGGGFCLMTEGLSLAAMLETPVVIILGQRPSPATGLPTRTEQSDLHLAIFSGHGEFARIVYAPGSLEEAFELTIKAFDVADRFQVPAIILTDQYLADITQAVDNLKTEGLPRKRQILSRAESFHVERYLRYSMTESGVSPRALPSWIPDVIYADSDEHTEEGHITEDSDVRTSMVDKRFSKKMKALRDEIAAPIPVHFNHARFLLLGFGSTKGVIEEICNHPDFQGFGGIHFRQVWPFPSEAFEDILLKAPGAELITVENNAGAQLAHLIKMETTARISRSILKYDGRPFTLEELGRRINHFRNNHGTARLQHA
jgi:2-oxoglutarate/2-oxoacid ferredoxin oxidoreductase subunit alpha